MTRAPDRSRRTFLTATLALPLAGCGSTLYGLDAATWEKSVGIAVGLEEKPGISLEDATKVPFSSLGYRIGSGVERMLVLATDNGEERLWTSSEHRTLATRGGRITKSAKFGWNLTDSQLGSNDPTVLGLLAGSLPAGPVIRLCDFRDINRYEVRISGKLENRGPEEISILGQQVQTVAFVESCTADEIDWEFTNTFWADAETGFVWKSIQTIHPNLDALTVEVLRPPG